MGFATTISADFDFALILGTVSLKALTPDSLTYILNFDGFSEQQGVLR
jgi:hypothetical protein